MSTLKTWDLTHESKPKIEYICDRCGLKTEDKTKMHVVCSEQVTYNPDKSLTCHLCDDCRSKFKKWIDRERRKWN